MPAGVRGLAAAPLEFPAHPDGLAVDPDDIAV
jgi:hypothetical protein